jgi:aspartate carbamoyltransferase catalytic subunit
MTFRQTHLLGIEPLHPDEIRTILDLADRYADAERGDRVHGRVLEGLTQINMFFEASTRTQASFEIAGKRLGADVMNMAMQASSIKKGETLIDTAMTLNAMHPDLLVVRHPIPAPWTCWPEGQLRRAERRRRRHEHPTQALLDALTIRREKGRLHRLTIAICGDIAHSRVARSNIHLLGKMENRVRLIGPPTLMPSAAIGLRRRGLRQHAEGLKDADVVMMLRLQKERMDGAFIPSEREYYHRFGLDAEKLNAEARRHRDAPGADEPRGRDRRDASPTTSTGRSSRNRSRWALPCAWQRWICSRATCARRGTKRRRQGG